MPSQIIQDSDGLVFEVVEGGPLPDDYNHNRDVARLRGAHDAWMESHGGTSSDAWDAVLAAAGVAQIYVRPIGGVFNGVEKVYRWDAKTGGLSRANERPSVDLYTRTRDGMEPDDVDGRKVAQDRIDALNRLGVDHAKIPDIEAEVTKGAPV